jgi:ribonuclease J
VDCVALAIHTPLGVVIHTGDFKVDPTPTDNHLFDLHAFAEYGKQGVLALFQDSTNVERKGYTPSERAVRRKFDEVFAHTKRRLFISCFSSSIHRIQPGVGTGSPARSQSCLRRPLNEQLRRNCRGPGLHRNSRRVGD